MRVLPVVALGSVVLAAVLFSRRAAAAVAPTETRPSEGSVLQDVYIAVSGIGSRGIRNNNPGNIRRTSTRWQGERAEVTDPIFEEFERPEDGIRAMTIIIKNYRRLYGLRTIPEIVNRYAPPSENDSGAYAETVSRRSGIPLSAMIDDQDLPRLIAAMIYVENGIQPYDVATIESGVLSA